MKLSKAVYYNKVLDETYCLVGVKDLKTAWAMARFVSRRNNWNFDMFSEDVDVSIKQIKTN